ncbi:sialate O-acetylesterase [Mucilaginibacter gracilis]|uniref:Sialate O-acetylesterase n=1 Tax=Mucilaginibacter gracilis TaxID=423350 RepID=A0A495J617_9SPHI|nr:sialate O-acetylesterase [Mucilaginibacter gracilis]RKR84317.1 sialate O-acetylesterase [Mucilaginibacter gracilis]
MIIKYKSYHRLLMLVCLCLLNNIAKAQPKLAALFTDNMVLQQKSTVQVWGWDKPSATLTLTSSWNKATYKTVAGADGRFSFKISTPTAGGPYQLTVNDGKPVTFTNILIGEVWICTGQSNMEMPMKGFKGQPIIGANEVILTSKNKNIRLYTVPRSSVTEPQKDSKPGQWREADPESVANFSATGYYFGRLINKVLDDVPVGLIHCSYSGSSIQAWMDAATLGAFPEIKVPAKGDTIKQASRTPTTLYNGMLYPILGYGIKGAIWYQGESNYDNPSQYEKLFETYVKTLRAQWAIGDFPFYYTQIAPYDYAQLPPYNKGGKYNSAFLRDAQRKEADKIPNTGMAVLMDIGEQATIHPPHKETAGTRMAYIALAKTYGIKGFNPLSPTYDNLTIKGNQAVVKFKDCPMGITSYFKELTEFEVAGDDKHFYLAKAVISGSTVTVSSPDVKAPVAVRYAFRDFIVGELFSTDGLPVSSFRTDDWDYNDAK